jgi:hypothetical protein
MDAGAGCSVIAMAGHDWTVTVAELLSVVPQLFVTRAKYVVVLVGETVTEDAVAPLIGVVPAYH